MSKKDPSQQRMRPKDRIDTFWVMINLGVARYWKISASGIEKSSAPAAHQGPVLTFDETADFRYALNKKIRASTARSYFLTEFQEKCRIFSTNPYIAYGTPIARLLQFEHVVYPGAYYIDALLDKNKVTFDEDRVVGFSLQVGGDDEFNIVVLFARRQNGDMSPPQVALNPPDIDLTIREFADQYKASDVSPILYGVNDIIGLQVGPGYPTEDLVLGTSVRVIKRGVAATLGSMTLVSAAVSGYYYTTAIATANQATDQQKATVRVSEQTEQLLDLKIHHFARLNSINTDAMFTYAESLWNNYSLVTYCNMDRQLGVLRASIPVQERLSDSAGTPIVKLNDYEEIKRQLSRETLEGLTRSKTIITQDTNSYEVQYNFKPLDHDFSAVVGIK